MSRAKNDIDESVLTRECGRVVVAVLTVGECGLAICWAAYKIF